MLSSGVGRKRRRRYRQYLEVRPRKGHDEEMVFTGTQVSVSGRALSAGPASPYVTLRLMLRRPCLAGLYAVRVLAARQIQPGIFERARS